MSWWVTVSRRRFLLISRPKVVSKEAKQKVARKNTATNKPIFGWPSVCNHWSRGGQVSRPSQPQQLDAQRAQRRPENEPQTEGHPDQAHPLRALGRRGDVGDVGLGDRD